MKDLLKYLLVCLVSIFSLNSCREDGDWGNNNEGVFSFAIERDTDYIEKALGEVNELKFNVKTKYDFASVPMKFKYTTSLNGVLMLNGKELEANEEYTLTNANNVFEYVGNEAGEHRLKISLKNDKGNSVTEEYSLKYATQDFQVNIEKQTGEIFQSELTSYIVKIVPTKKDESNKYYIKFNSYDGVVQLNGVPAEFNKEYPIHNIEYFTIGLSTNKIGKQRLDYTIRNNSVKRNLEIQQDIVSRKIEILGVNISSENVLPKTSMSLVGIVSKTPKTGNNGINYKTWVSSATNNNINGIETTNNVWKGYALKDGNFKIDFVAKEVGEYVLNFQVQDEFGNESAVKSFNVKVEEDLAFTIEPEFTAHIEVRRGVGMVGSSYWKYKGTQALFEVKGGNLKKISKYKVDIIFDFPNDKRENETRKYSYSKIFDALQSEIKVNEVFNDDKKLNHRGYEKYQPSNLNYVITVYDNNDNPYEKTGTIKFEIKETR